MEVAYVRNQLKCNMFTKVEGLHNRSWFRFWATTAYILEIKKNSSYHIYQNLMVK